MHALDPSLTHTNHTVQAHYLHRAFLKFSEHFTEQNDNNMYNSFRNLRSSFICNQLSTVESDQHWHLLHEKHVLDHNSIATLPSRSVCWPSVKDLCMLQIVVAASCKRSPREFVAQIRLNQDLTAPSLRRSISITTAACWHKTVPCSSSQSALFSRTQEQSCQPDQSSILAASSSQQWPTHKG